MSAALPFFTIIIPTYNSEALLEGALNSILSQDFVDYEVCVVDGLSTDGTFKLANQLAERDGRIRAVSEADEGIYDAMNKGVRMAKGKWLYFLGSDDRLQDSNVLMKVWQELEQATELFFYGNVWMNRRLYDGSFDLNKLMVRNISHQAIFYQRSLFNVVGDYNINFRLHADWDFNIRCFLRTDFGIRHSAITVARFGAGGVSAGYDLPFLRQSLIPVKMRLYKQAGGQKLSIRDFDNWWRLIRNAKIGGLAELEAVSGGDKLPAKIASIVQFQAVIPGRLLRFGPCSKALMTACYLTTLTKSDRP